MAHSHVHHSSNALQSPSNDSDKRILNKQEQFAISIQQIVNQVGDCSSPTMIEQLDDLILRQLVDVVDVLSPAMRAHYQQTIDLILGHVQHYKKHKNHKSKWYYMMDCIPQWLESMEKEDASIPLTLSTSSDTTICQHDVQQPSSFTRADFLVGNESKNLKTTENLENTACPEQCEHIETISDAILTRCSLHGDMSVQPSSVSPHTIKKDANPVLTESTTMDDHHPIIKDGTTNPVIILPEMPSPNHKQSSLSFTGEDYAVIGEDDNTQVDVSTHVPKITVRYKTSRLVGKMVQTIKSRISTLERLYVKPNRIHKEPQTTFEKELAMWHTVQSYILDYMSMINSTCMDSVLNDCTATLLIACYHEVDRFIKQEGVTTSARDGARVWYNQLVDILRTASWQECDFLSPPNRTMLSDMIKFRLLGDDDVK